MQCSMLSLQSPRSRWLVHIFGGCGASRGLVPTGKMAKKALAPTTPVFLFARVTGWGAGAYLIPRDETLYFGVTYYMIFSSRENVTVG